MRAVIMAGGKGTRIASITNDEIPKPMLKIGDKPILEHQINCLKKSGIIKIVIIVGHLGEKIVNYFGDGKRFGVEISYIKEEEKKPLGTAGSLFFLKDRIREDFVLVFGDVFFDVDFKKMIEFHKKHCAVVTLLTHPNSHPFDSDLIIVGKNDVVVGFDSKENNRENRDYCNIVNSGIYVLSPLALGVITQPVKMAIEKDVIQRFIKDGKVFSYHSTEYVKDMGTPERYKAVNEDYRNGIPSMRNLENKQKCIFLDRDGTINRYSGYILDRKDLVLLDGVASAIKKINSSEYLCIVVTNQPIIARGESSIENLNKIHAHLQTLLGREGAYVDDILYCPHHPDKGFDGEVAEYKIDCDCRKPKPGMVKKAAKRYNLDLEASFMVGDSWRDIELGENAEMHTCLVESGEAVEDSHSVHPELVAKDLQKAVEIIIERKLNGFQEGN